MSQEKNARFDATERLFSEESVKSFQAAHVCVVGLGGVGSWAVEALARTAIGQLTLIDMDSICITNTNRQLHALDGSIGQAKAEVLKDRVLQINPECKVKAIQAEITAANMEELILPKFDYVIDAIDCVRDKAALVAYSVANNIPVITSGGAGGKLDPSCIEVTDLAKTHQDPLAAKLRYLLRRYHGFSKKGKRFAVDCVYSVEPLRYPMGTAVGFGTSVCVTATFGLKIASVVLEKLQITT